jgi:phenylpyruvate tautomerase PptA (4-oxalocrotonate tautomerase family)
VTIMRVSLAGAPLEADQKRELAERLIGAFAEVEVGRDSPQIREGFVVHFEALAASDLWMGGRPMIEAGSSGRAAIVTTQVMAGPWNDAMKAALFARIEQAVRDVAQMPRAGSGADLWMTFVEVPEGSWGLGGRPVSIERLAPVFSDDRQARIRAYLTDRKPLPPARNSQREDT